MFTENIKIIIYIGTLLSINFWRYNIMRNILLLIVISLALTACSFGGYIG